MSYSPNRRLILSNFQTATCVYVDAVARPFFGIYFMNHIANISHIPHKSTLTVLPKPKQNQSGNTRCAFLPLADLVLIRGLPGSGKSTMASVLSMIGYKHFEADMYFQQDGVYHYDSSLIRDAHVWCQQRMRSAMDDGHKVVVSNTFTRMRELDPYIRIARGTIQILEARGTWDNIHDVPQQVSLDMSSRWERLPTLMQNQFDAGAHNKTRLQENFQK